MYVHVPLCMCLCVCVCLSVGGRIQPARYYMLMEDDFPLCERPGGDELLWLLAEASRRVPHHCGVFVATGGRYVWSLHVSLRVPMAVPVPASACTHVCVCVCVCVYVGVAA
jgi:hypothetical protein